MPNTTEALRRRMLIGYLGILVTLYAAAVVSSPDYASSRGEVGAVALCVVGLALAVPGSLRGWRYVCAAACVGAAPMVASLFHEQPVAQVWAVVPLMFVTIYLRTWHPLPAARALAVLVAACASATLEIAPAEVPGLWLVVYAVCIIGAPEVFGLLNASLVDAALRDPLTSVWNRAGVDRQAGVLIVRAQRRAEPIAVIVLDVDHFKSINDRYGHAVGDRVLGDLASRWTSQLPSSAVIGRMGGDEFVVVVGGYDEDRARALADALGNEHEVGVTTGVAVGRSFDDATLADLISAADEDLYRRKRSRDATTAPILEAETGQGGRDGDRG
ncbi:GGDEF domain-containing protein [Mycobacterium hodleri]|uniref:GGDEF domain-containing protein n=1 Tax=Mycolicibacterium hodleri TaxID=49897 RepID=UPI0021F3AA27|nr:GGDEF domain-containing protein [Mycolicibacterium hodleri]MCV7134102.1 GGDEF domain-containing protein [Mycolicibacterium hodleri]